MHDLAPVPPALLRMHEVMAYLRVGRSTVYRLMWNGYLRGHKVGNTWRFYRRDVVACIQEQAPTKEYPDEASRPHARMLRTSV